jgi:Tryptophan-associated transmembrane protein (Trp_oprn_chp)
MERRDDVGRRRELAVAVLLCAAGAAAVLIATRQTWAVELTQRPAPLPELREEQTGGGLRPWLPALGWAALAGAGALLAVRRVVRRVLGGLLVLAGAAMVPGALTISGGWPLLAAAGGLAVAAAGALTIARGARWPSMGARYDRPARTRHDSTDPAQLWQALDRGEDPTA